MSKKILNIILGLIISGSAFAASPCMCVEGEYGSELYFATPEAAQLCKLAAENNTSAARAEWERYCDGYAKTHNGLSKDEEWKTAEEWQTAGLRKAPAQDAYNENYCKGNFGNCHNCVNY